MEQTLGKRIMQHRKRLGLTQEQLAEKLNVTAQAVSKWENDQSCPDIAVLPKLAAIFGITTDSLLGNEAQSATHDGEVVTEENESNGLHAQKGNWEFRYDSGKRGAIGFALLVFLVGIQLLLAKFLSWDITFWGTLWPSAILIFGLMGLTSKFSLFNAGCALVGLYFVTENLQLLPFQLSGDIVFPAALVLLGLMLLMEALKKPNKPVFHFQHNGKKTNDYRTQGDTFEFSASFGDNEQLIAMPRLSYGKISTSFGDYDLDLSGVEELSENCKLEISCSFGELTLHVPQHYAVRPSTSTSFADFSVEGHPDENPKGILYVTANVSFGELTVHYM